MSAGIPVSVIVITKDEEASLPECLDALGDFDDVVVVDSNSTDRTVDIAEARGYRVVQFGWNGQYPKKKQWALDNSGPRHEWVLLLDADERPTPALVSELRALFGNGKDPAEAGAFDVPLEYEWQGRRLRYGHRVVKRALLHRDRCRFPDIDDLDVAQMWEVEGHYQPQTTWAVRRTSGRLLHQDRDPVFSWFSRHNRYSDWEAHLRARSVGRDVARLRSRGGRLFARMPGKPLAFFFHAFVLRAGFLDGRAGLDYAVAQAFYYWQIDLKVRERNRLSSEHR